MNIPAHIRREPGLAHGGAVIAGVVDGTIRMRALRHILTDLQTEAQPIFAGSGETKDRVIEALLEGAAMTTLNFAEVATKHVLRGARPQAETLSARLPIILIPIDEDLALRSALMADLTRSAGLSIGDQICLARGQRTGQAALTADPAGSRGDAPLAKVSVTTDHVRNRLLDHRAHPAQHVPAPVPDSAILPEMSAAADWPSPAPVPVLKTPPPAADR